MKFEITGQILQMINLELTEGEKVYSESGRMVWMSENIKMDTHAKGGIGAGIGRMLAGESFFLTDFYPEGGTGVITFAAEYPGKVIEKKLGNGESLICQKDSFVCAENSVKLEMHFRKKLGAGLFGGEGFILQKVTGPGQVFLNVGGELVKYELTQGQKLLVDTGCIAAFEPTVNYDIQRVGGLKNIIFGGEGLFLATLEGPGTVWLQSMPVMNLAMKLWSFMPKTSN